MTSSAKIARTGFSFARDYLPPSPIASPIFRSTGEEADLEAEFPPPATNGSDPLDVLTEVRFIKLSDKATLPTRAHDNDAGLDLYAAEGARIPSGERVSVGTGLAVAIPDGFAGLVLPRSGLALKHGVTVLNTPGTIDSDYRGEIKVVLANFGDEDFVVRRGDRIAQLVVAPVARAHVRIVTSLEPTARGDGGYGSTGVRD